MSTYESYKTTITVTDSGDHSLSATLFEQLARETSDGGAQLTISIVAPWVRARERLAVEAGKINALEAEVWRAKLVAELEAEVSDALRALWGRR